MKTLQVPRFRQSEQDTTFAVVGTERDTRPGWTPDRDAAGRALVRPIERLRHALEWQLPAKPGKTERWLLNGLVEMLGADLAFTCRNHSRDRWELHAYSYVADPKELEDAAGRALLRLGDLVRAGGAPAGGWRATAPDGTETIAVRLTGGSDGAWLFLVGDSMPKDALGEPIGVVARAVVMSHAGGRDPSPVRAQAAAWDAALAHLGAVPTEMYEARRAAFVEQLSALVPVFAPVLYLHREHPGIDGWEAVPHGGRGDAADMYAAARLWGPEFLRLLDRRMLHCAIRDYLVQVRDAPSTTSQGLPMPRGLTVDVHAASLLADEVTGQLEAAIHRPGGIRGTELALEVAGLCGPEDQEELRRRITGLRDRLGVGIVVDAVRTRQELASPPGDLDPTYVKLDEWLTGQQQPGVVAGMVEAAIATPWAGPQRTVVTGFADQPPFQLEDAFALGVRLLQGEFVGLPTRELRLEPTDSQLARIRRAADRVRLRPASAGAGAHGTLAHAERIPGFGRAGD